MNLTRILHPIPIPKSIYQFLNNLSRILQINSPNKPKQKYFSRVSRNLLPVIAWQFFNHPHRLVNWRRVSSDTIKNPRSIERQIIRSIPQYQLYSQPISNGKNKITQNSLRHIREYGIILLLHFTIFHSSSGSSVCDYAGFFLKPKKKW